VGPARRRSLEEVDHKRQPSARDIGIGIQHTVLKSFTGNRAQFAGELKVLIFKAEGYPVGKFVVEATTGVPTLMGS
jgi:hypothetical protein